LVKKILLISIVLLLLGCGPNEQERSAQINNEFDKLIRSLPTPTPIVMPTPLPTPTPIVMPTPLPTPTPSLLSKSPYLETRILTQRAELLELLINPYSTPVPLIKYEGNDVKKAYEEFRSSVVQISADGSTGTGWAISKDYIVTNEHVISGQNSVTIYVPKGTSAEEKTGLVKSWDESADLAFIKSENHGATPLPLRILTSKDIGTTVVQLGHSTGTEEYPAVRSGVVVSVFNQMGTVSQYGSAQKYKILEGFEYSDSLMPIVVVNTGADPGDSGGPIIDFEGNVLGVIYSQVVSTGGKRIIGQQLAVGSGKVNKYWESCIGAGGSCD